MATMTKGNMGRPQFWTVRRFLGLLIGIGLVAYLAYTLERYASWPMAVIIAILSVLLPQVFLMATTFIVRPDRQGTAREVVKLGFLLIGAILAICFAVLNVKLLQEGGQTVFAQRVHLTVFTVGTTVVAQRMWWPARKR